MFKNFSPGLFFAMAGVTVIILAPFIMIFHPIFQMELFSVLEQGSMFIPNPVNLRLIVAACVILAGTLGILAYKREKKMFALGALLILLSAGTAYLSTQNYLLISDGKIERQHFFDEQRYGWDELDEIVYEYGVGNKSGDITLTAKTGEQFVIKEKEVHSAAKSQIYQLARANGVGYIEREKK